MKSGSTEWRKVNSISWMATMWTHGTGTLVRCFRSLSTHSFSLTLLTLCGILSHFQSSPSWFLSFQSSPSLATNPIIKWAKRSFTPVWTWHNCSTQFFCSFHSVSPSFLSTSTTFKPLLGYSNQNRQSKIVIVAIASNSHQSLFIFVFKSHFRRPRGGIEFR